MLAARSMVLGAVLSCLLMAALMPCVLQRTCPARSPRPTSRVCMHRIPDPYAHSQYKALAAQVRARVLLSPLSRLSLAAVLLLLSLRLHIEPLMMTLLYLILAITTIHQATAECKNCVVGKEERAMFRAHSDACLPQSGVDPKTLGALLRGELVDAPALRRHVYCVLLKCKMVGKDGKLLKTAVLGKMAVRGDGRNVTKIMESCANQTGDSPEDLAWNLFRCGYDKKAVLFEYMPVGSD